jgi:RHS repeat-associated protein
VVWRAVYAPFGEATIDAASTATLNLRFPGQYYDQETGMHYNYFRYYDPETGRYMRSDPIGLVGGMNTYAYVLGSPLRWSDYRGLDNPGCDMVPDFVESNCMLNMCSKHDYCYFENRCSATSWLLPFSKCNLRCNLPAVSGTFCAASYAIIGRSCVLNPDMTPRDNMFPQVPYPPKPVKNHDVWEWE